ncbi:hypothetical protein [uncultured Methylobacterium sp.]|jgi:hypothetical protein|uniref:hypothetical protein n=1 Tax=uncultured Methylobacterium sp. TaxID=157278 RepID=UPI00260724A2|nr:hypothetical protein [uncultured Methylobacterium sp.]
MITYDQAVELKRSKLVDIVDVLCARHGKKMDAYKAVGAFMERSPTWVRRVVGRSASVRIDLHDALNIGALHDRLCAHLAAGTAEIEAGNDDLRRQIDALVRGDLLEGSSLGATGAPEATAQARAEAPTLPPVPGPSAPAPDAPGHADLGLTHRPL